MESFDPYLQWLGRPPGRPPRDHYELLGLERFEPDLDLIARSADSLRAKVRRIRPGPHAADWQRLLDRIEAAKICLGDPIAKLAYDESIDTASHKVDVGQGPGVTEETPSQAAASSRAEEGGDPNGAPTSHDERGAPVAPQFIEAPPMVREAGSGAALQHEPSAKGPYPSIQAVSGKRVRGRFQVWLLSGCVAGLAIVLGLAVFRQWQDDAQTAVRSVPASASGSNSSTGSKAADSPAVRTTEETLSSDQGDIRPRAAGADSLSSSQATEPTIPVRAPSATEKTTAIPLPTPPSMTPSPTPRVKVDPAKQEVFREALESARRTLAARDLETAESHLQEALLLAQSDEEIAEADQVGALRAHVDAFWASLQELIPRLEAGSSIRVGERRVGIVEAGPDRVVLRVTGRSRPYSIGGMPHVLAAALAEQLFSNSPNAKALRAAFLIAEPEGDEAVAHRLLREAAQEGADVDELLKELNRSG